VKTRIRPLFGGRALADWIRAGGRPARRVTAYVPRLCWHASWFEHNWSTQVRRLDKTNLPDDPVFVVGLWRSGTTALHELLAAATDWPTPQTWQCFNPSSCFLAPPPASDTPVDRPMDQGRISARSPQEDEFALLLLGEPSLYRAFIDPRRLLPCAETLWSSGDAPLERWQTFVRGISLGASGRRLLLKSPTHTFRMSRLRATFPRARFVWMARNPGEMIASNLKMWRVMFDLYALWPCPTGILEAFLDRMVEASTRVLTECLDEMHRDNLLWVDFEELRAAPKVTLERVLVFLESGLPPSQNAPFKLNQALASIAINDGSRSSLPGNGKLETLEKLMASARQRFARTPVK
jgi:hypothetical protein